jgi:2-methylisocitrate lyase-like PEP mutase family enzyme
MSYAKQFFALHHRAQLLMLPNVWDAASALLVQAAGAEALATSSASLAWSLGYADGGYLPEAERLSAVRRLLRVARLPLSIDLEDGYSSDPEAVAAHVEALVELGVAGINLEDGQQPVELLVAKIEAVRRRLGGRPLFINARTDTYLSAIGSADSREAETLQRLRCYAAAGADGAFVPVLTDLAVAQRLAQACTLPLNLMAMPGLPAPAALLAAGVRRLSQGAATFLLSYGALAAALPALLGGAPDGAGLNGARMNALALQALNENPASASSAHRAKA